MINVDKVKTALTALAQLNREELKEISMGMSHGELLAIQEGFWGKNITSTINWEVIEEVVEFNREVREDEKQYIFNNLDNYGYPAKNDIANIVMEITEDLQWDYEVEEDYGIAEEDYVELVATKL